MQRPLVLSGFMATGKSTVARRLAELTGAEAIDLDSVIEERAGASIRRIFEQQGEAAFRRLERAELDRVLSLDDPVAVAVGGGALERRGDRLRALDRAVVVTLEGSPAEITRRAAASEARPLLDAADPRDREAHVARLLESRAVAYAEAHARVSTDGASPDEVARRVLEVWKQDAVAVAAAERSYCVRVGRDLLDDLGSAAAGSSSVVFVSDSNVAPLHLAAAKRAASHDRVAEVVLDAGERHKTAASLETIWRAAQAAGADRRSVLVAVGGGVVTDVAGFAAATWMRGVRWIAVPTTLLAMVDASVGGKTAVDLGEAKNAVGAFWQPSLVLCDVELERTEPDRGYTSALAEVVKTALIGDAELFDLLESRAADVRRRDPDLVSELVRRSVRVKARVVGEDEREGGVRATLNLGHTVGHALEAHGGYGRLTHGEAVSLGLVAALAIGQRLGHTPAALAERATAVLASLGLPTDLAAQPLAEAVRLIAHDKKRAGNDIRFVFARDVGRVEARPLSMDELTSLAASLARMRV